MELWQLRTFTSVAKHLHFTRASEELNLSQPAVSHQIKALEREIGEPLFLRSNDGIFLTKAGETMLEHSIKVLDIADQIFEEIEQSKKEPHGTIIFSTVMMSLENPFPKMYQEFKKSYENIDLKFQNELRSSNILSKIEKGEIDVGLVAVEAPGEHLVEIPYGSFRVSPVCSVNHPLAEKKKISPADLENAKWALIEPQIKMREHIDKKFDHMGISPKRIFETNDGSVILGLLSMGETISLLPLWGIVDKLEKNELCILNVKELEFDVQLCLVWRANRNSQTVKTFIKFLLEHQITGVKLDQSNKT